MVSSGRVVHMVGHGHIDPVWLWRWPEGLQEARATFWSAIHRMAEHPDFVFTCDQIA
jgi:alpha-mannosidase